MDVISLLPLDPAYHTAALQRVYESTPDYWRLYRLTAAPSDRAAHDLCEAAQTPGRVLTGIVRRIHPDSPQSDAELVGLLDFRLAWPDQDCAYLAMLMVAKPYQRRGIGSQAWQLLKPWLAQTAQMERVRTGVEQFNFKALRFFQAQGFALSGEADRIRIADRLIRLLYLEIKLAAADGAGRAYPPGNAVPR